MKTKLTHFIAQHLDEDVDSIFIERELDGKQPLPEMPRCAFSGEIITEGVPITKVIKPATANIADTFRFPSDYVSVAAAKLFKAQREMRGNLFITADGIQHPLILAKSAKQLDRPTWQKIFTGYLNTLSPAVIILTDESKRRLFPDAVVTAGNPIIVFMNNSTMSCTIQLDKSKLSECMQLVIECLKLGFSKSAISNSLFRHREMALKTGWAQTRQLETQCQAVRSRPEMAVAIFIGTLTDDN